MSGSIVEMEWDGDCKLGLTVGVCAVFVFFF